MKYLCRPVLSLASLVCMLSVNAQYTDTAGSAAPAIHTITVTERDHKENKKAFSTCSYIVPAAFIVYGVLSIHTDAFADVNETIKEEVYTERQPRKVTIDNYLQYSPAVAVYALNAAGVHGINNFRDRTIIYGISSLLGGITVTAVKHITKEVRPDGSDNLSFPSGHSSTAFASAEFLRQEYKDVSVWYGVAGYAVAAATGYLRVQNNKHWAGDVVAGAGVGIISTRLAYCMYPAIKRKLFKNKPVNTVVLPTCNNGSWGLGMVRQL